ncbi:hypothetical protein [Metabacillus halosaccharovorans]|uniref:hypothetical protein n=1 Tax=Metabacillus halosaccharovorans TaxID=930124 RepID=UPI002040F28F|nr:hypothetical protein [Metabacillus halosaccharovorans]MCM3439413.1 hypothetical protein [Metabacillus halosaccharovorans]
MPSISKIRFTNVVYEDGNKRYNDEIFKFDGYNGAILLENGGGKTVFIQTALQAIIPHTNLSDRKIKQTLQLDNYPAHIAIEWILSENPRRYLVTCVSLFLTKDGLGSYRYVYPYQAGDRHGIEHIPFVRKASNRPSDRGEISDYYQQMTQQQMNAQTFPTIKAFQQHIEEQYHIIANEWESIVKINSTEGGVEAFFDECKQTNQLFDRLLIPTVEGAIAGHNEDTFVDTFEKHRSSFKLYKELKEQIEENKAIEEELNRYVVTYEGLHDEQQAYEQMKQRAKAVLNLIHRQEQELVTYLNDLESSMKEWEKESRYHQKRELSLKIQKEQSVLDRLQVKRQEQLQQVSIGKDDLSHAKTRFYSLKLAELKQLQKEEQDRLHLLQEQLSALVHDQDIQDIQDKLDNNSQELKGYFTHELEETKKRMQELKIEKQPIIDQSQEYRRKEKAQHAQLEKAKVIFNQNIGIIQSLENQLNRIRNKILSKPDQESVKERVQQWEKRFVYLDDEIVRLKTENKQLQGKITKCKEEQELVSRNKVEKESAYIKLESEIEQVERAHDKVKEGIGVLRSGWVAYDSIYLKQDSLTQQIHDSIQRLNKNREDTLYHERLASRFMDDYGNQDLFFADPYIEKQVKQWSNQFHLLETGVQFIQSLEKSVMENAMNYSLWPITLITTGTEQEQLKQKIYHINKHLQFPIEVLSIEQARAIVQGEQLEMSPIAPNHWLENQQYAKFQEWKQIMKERADAASKARKEIETTLEVWNRAAERLAGFLTEYPYDEYQERKDRLSKLHQNIQELSLEQRTIQATLAEYENQLSTQKDTIETYEKEHQGLQGKLESAHEYLSLDKEKTQLKKTQDQLSLQISSINSAIKKIEYQIERLNEEKARIEEQERDENTYFSKLIDDPLYLEVKTSDLKFTNKAFNILKEEREELTFSLRKLSSTRREIEIKLDYSQKEINRISKGIDETILYYGPLDEDLVFPPNGKEQIASFHKKMKVLEKLVNEATEKLTVANENKIKQEKVVELAVDHFQQIFSEEQPHLFTDSLSDVQDRLINEKKQLQEKVQFLQREQKRINKELESIKTAFHELDRYEEAHHFKGPSVLSPVLAEHEIQEFTYERMAFVKNVTNDLKQGKDQVVQEIEKVERAKETFKTFCKAKITNVKMQKMARDGIDTKHTYKEVVEFQTHMQKRIQTAIKYNEASIIDHDKQLEQFVTHINSHLHTIAGELKIIPKKTKVKVEDKWKEIYKFSIPEWTEEEGKSRIRKHIEWILEQLESEKYLNTEGIEDYGKVRRDIETWIQSKQLLRVVMNNEMMKVTCRKVTNDNEVTTRSYSWEQSNVWSGGEKWSKNMTLFLGILNYVAEKQKHSEANMKRHRVVIMDNPFGKASSDHVLNPVFFIAEQLGFQIIALTAHAEGKFLRDYFPVIYSCRLRKAADSNKQIMTKVKQLHQAYFQDHEPQALDRLGEVEQMELF